ncbi:MAG: ATP-binding protein [Myxococcales bacterium]|nr:ATP-binding protein [Myxococcales bacterium]MCB9731718.1 ATP-binding protein [Deltaproteobacteria bacterium]
MSRIHLVLGPVGAGKSTFGQRLAFEHGAVRLTLDDWFAPLFSPDRPPGDARAWYMERVERVLARIEQVADDVLDVGKDVVLEVGLIRRAQRDAFFARRDEERHGLVIYELNAPRDIRRERVARRNAERGATWAMEVPPAVFELASDLWEPLADDERAGRDVRDVTTG